jgi:hypothetical protein
VSEIEAATRRLAAALDSLEAALDRRSTADARELGLTSQISVLGNDRSRLAAELEQQTARAQRLDAMNREVSRRIEVTIESVRMVVDRHARAS